MKHKHYDLIVAWANGATIEFFARRQGEWRPAYNPTWDVDMEYRIKPEPKPDSVKIRKLTYNADIDCVLLQSMSDARDANMMFIFDGETGALKDAQVLAKLV